MGLLAAALLLAAPASAAAHDRVSVGAEAQERPSLFAQADLPCVDRRELWLCLSEDDAADAFPWSMREGPAAPPSKLILFTRLAGMFMGRVDAGSLGSFRLRFKLTLR